MTTTIDASQIANWLQLLDLHYEYDYTYLQHNETFKLLLTQNIVKQGTIRSTSMLDTRKCKGDGGVGGGGKGGGDVLFQWWVDNLLRLICGFCCQRSNNHESLQLSRVQGVWRRGGGGSGCSWKRLRILDVIMVWRKGLISYEWRTVRWFHGLENVKFICVRVRGIWIIRYQELYILWDFSAVQVSNCDPSENTVTCRDWTTHEVRGHGG